METTPLAEQRWLAGFRAVHRAQTTAPASLLMQEVTVAGAGDEKWLGGGGSVDGDPPANE